MILLIVTEHFSCLHDRDLQYSSAFYTVYLTQMTCVLCLQKLHKTYFQDIQQSWPLSMFEGPKKLLLSMFFHEQRYKKRSLDKEEATLVRLVALNIHHNQIQVHSKVNNLPCI